MNSNAARNERGRLDGRALLVFLALLSALAMPGKSAAQMVVPLTVEDMAGISQDVVYGTVVESKPDWYGGKLFTRSKLQVHESFKGTAEEGDSVEVLTLGGDFGQLSSVSPGMPTLEDAEEVIVFLSNPAVRRRARGMDMDSKSPFANHPQIVGGFQGKFKVVREEIEHEAVNKQRRSSSVAKVVRQTPGAGIGRDGAPSLEQFRQHLRETLNQANRRSVKRIPTAGEVEVPAKNPNATSLRYFDPAPYRQGASGGRSLPSNAVLLHAPDGSAGRRSVKNSTAQQAEEVTDEGASADNEETQE